MQAIELLQFFSFQQLTVTQHSTLTRFSRVENSEENSTHDDAPNETLTTIDE